MSLVAKSIQSSVPSRKYDNAPVWPIHLTLWERAPEMGEVAFPLICYSIDHRWYTERTVHLSRLKKGTRIMIFATLPWGPRLTQEVWCCGGMRGLWPGRHVSMTKGE